jgi:hypothetical protein
MCLQLVADNLVAALGIDGRKVDDVDKHPRSGHVAQEGVAQAGAATGALDQTGHIGHRHAPFIRWVDRREVQHPKVGLQRREGIWRDLRRGCCQGAEEGRLAGVRKADQADVGDEPELQIQPALFPWLALLGVGRRAIGCGREMHVAQPAAAAASNHHPLVASHQIGDQVLGCQIAHHRTWRDAQVQVFACFAVLFGTRAAATRISSKVMLESVVTQHRLAGIDVQVHAAAAAAVASIWSAARHMSFPSKARRTVAAVSGPDGDRHFIEKCHLVRNRTRGR